MAWEDRTGLGRIALNPSFLLHHQDDVCSTSAEDFFLLMVDLPAGAILQAELEQTDQHLFFAKGIHSRALSGA